MITRKLCILLLWHACFLASSDFANAQVWTETSAPTNAWTGIATSADGKTMIAASTTTSAGNGSIFISTDSGVTWTQTSAPTNSWYKVASSADGMRLIAAQGSDNAGAGYIYTSPDGGTTWISNSIPTLHWQSIACSSDGSKLFAFTYFGQFYRSTNFGTNWISNSAPGSVTIIASSADGTKLAGAAGNGRGKICTSTDSGLTWTTNNSPSENWASIACSADGTKLIATTLVSGPGNVYLSTDSGVSWISNNVPQKYFTWVGMSANANLLIGATWQGSGGMFGNIYTSTNFGQSWVSNNLPVANWNGVACSADGGTLVAASGIVQSPAGPSIWTSQTTLPPLLNTTKSGSNVLLSWTIPSSNFALQESGILPATAWADISAKPALNLTNLHNEVLLPSGPGNAFFRLNSK